MAVTEVIHFHLWAQLATRRLFLARFRPEPARGAPSPRWALTPIYSVLMSSNQLLSLRWHSPHANASPAKGFAS